jgi:hypothetical protein
MSDRLERWERIVAVFLSATVVVLHAVAAASSGALWRDEANTVGLATLPTIGDVWRNLQYDSFPILWLLIVRWCSALFGPMNDLAFRLLGFLIGVGIVGALWLNARAFRHRLPLFSLVLLGMAPSLIVWGDSVRAYGFGILLILVTCALLWRFLEQPDLQRFLAASLAAIASVQTLFYNAVLLLAFCAGAVAVCGLKRDWKTAGQVVLCGALAAVSLLPYVTTIKEASTWNALVRIPHYDLSLFFYKLNETLSSGGFWGLFLWLELLVIAVFVASRALRWGEDRRLSELQRNVVVFCLVTLAVGIAGNFFFLKTLSYPTEPWYYLALLALVGLCVDAIFGACTRTRRARTARLIAVSIIGCLTILPAERAVGTRLTNVDLIASELRLTGRPRDLVIVDPWHFGVSFDRYYHGSAAWITSPVVPFHRFHRYDMIRKQLLMPDQNMVLSAVIERTEKTLRNGSRVFVVGDSVMLPKEPMPMPLPPAPLPGSLWYLGPYTDEWSASLAYFLERHAVTLTRVSVKPRRGVSDFENLRLLVATGWRD